MTDEVTKRAVGCIYFLGFIYLIGEIGGLVVLLINESYDKDLIYTIMIIATILLAIAFSWWTNIKKRRSISIAENETRKWEQRARIAEKDVKARETAITKEFKKKENEFKVIEQQYHDAIKTKTPFSHVAKIFSDWESVCYDDVAYFLRTKPHPAFKRAESVEELKEKFKVTKSSLKEMEYKYLFLLNTFPELKRYIDDEETLKHLADYKDYEDFKNERDEVLDYISTEEYKKLSEDERNQLALDRYEKGKKSNWQIGMQYEMYIGHLLRENNFKVVQYGIENGLEDLGRDIIARRVEDGIEKVYIIQCKNWAKDKLVHENVVCQIYGTSIQYELANKDLFSDETRVVIPMLVTTNPISDMAKKFADKLGVQCLIRPLNNFPMIKCNINNGNKIYHLPFDQQYYRTQIKLSGEFYAWTVEEAVNAGFRRARRHLFEK